MDKVAVTDRSERPDAGPDIAATATSAAAATSATSATAVPAVPVSTAGPAVPVSTAGPAAPVSTAGPAAPVSTAGPAAPVATAVPAAGADVALAGSAAATAASARGQAGAAWWTQLPYVLVLAVTAGGLAWIWLGTRNVHVGMMTVASALLAAALFRLVLPERAAGLLVSRRRVADVLALASLGACVMAAVLVLPAPS